MERYEVNRLEDLQVCRTTGEGETSETRCVGYYPGALAELEDDLNAARDKSFEDEFFCRCS